MLSSRYCILDSCVTETSSISATTLSTGAISSSVIAVFKSSGTLASERYLRITFDEVSTRHVVQGILQLITIGNRRLCRHKGPLLFTNVRRAFSKHLERPYKDKYASTKACLGVSSTRKICTGEVYNRVHQRFCYVQPYPRDCIYVVKYPDFFKWKNLPSHISTLNVSIYSEHPLVTSVLIITTSTNQYHFLPQDIKRNKFNQHVYDITYHVDISFKFGDKVSITLYVRDIYGNYISKEALW